MMLKLHSFSIIIMLVFTGFSTLSQENTQIIYKEINGVSLEMDACYPMNFTETETYPAMLLFHGGGWKKGDQNDLGEVANYFTGRGFITFLVSYRVKFEHGTNPLEAVKDTKSAIRYVRKHAEQLYVDPSKIVVSGISAGGHLAATSAANSTFNNIADDLSVSAQANALILYCPLLDIGPGGYGYHAIAENYLELSPLHIIKDGLPPTIIIVGTKDRYLSMDTAKLYATKMKEAGNICELIFLRGVEHGFLWKDKPQLTNTILQASETFLQEYGF